jgi:hypothetical protein
MADFFSEVQAAVPTDTFEMFPITPEQVYPDEYVMQQLDAWLAGDADEPDLSTIWTAGETGLMLGTAGAIGQKYAGNPQVSDWVQRQRYKIAETLQGAPPAQKNRIAGLWEQGFYKGQQSAVKDAMENGPGEQIQPTPVPSPAATPRPGGVPDVIRLLADKTVEELDVMLEIGAISQEDYDEALALKGIAR